MTRFRAFLLGTLFGSVATLAAVGAYYDHRTEGKLREKIAHWINPPKPPADMPVFTPDPKDTAPTKIGQVAPIAKRFFPDDNPWNQDISKEPVDPNSENIIRAMGWDTSLHPDFGTVYQGAPNGIPYVVVPGTQPKVKVVFEPDYADESDPGPYPIPPDAPIEGGKDGKGDRHVLVFDRDNGKLYEIFRGVPQADGSWKAGGGAIFDVNSNQLRPRFWTSADAAGLPILPGLVRYDEVVEKKEINHALRFTVPKTRQGFVAPATHFTTNGGPDPNLPPMGMRVRLKASVDISRFPEECQVILRALQKYGMFVADNGGPWQISGAPDVRWSDDRLHAIKAIKGHDFEVVRMGRIITDYKQTD